MSATERKEISDNLAKTLLEPMLLGMVLKEKKIHAYGAISKIKKDLHVYLGPSTVYPLFKKMEKKGYVKSEWDMSGEKPRKMYSPTSKTETVYRAWMEELRVMSLWNSDNTIFMIEPENEIKPTQHLRNMTR